MATSSPHREQFGRALARWALLGLVVTGCAEASRPLPDAVLDTDVAASDTAEDLVLPPQDTSAPDASQPDHCGNGQRDADETGIDCGGVCTRGCAVGDACRVPSDCAGLRCAGGVCQALGCQDDPDCPTDLPWCSAGQCVACVRADHCEDGNLCTDDRCELGQCVHDPAPNPCDDGLFCNGEEACQAGSCVTIAAPCGGAAVACNESTRTCDECAADQDCGQPVVGEFGPCEPPANQPCAQQGTWTRQVTTPRCVDGACTQLTETQSETCGRQSEGQACGVELVGAWDVDCASGCGTVTRTRTIETPTCSAGQCVPIEQLETDTCQGLTNGTRCSDDGTYCGQPLPCHVCQGDSCALNSPHYASSCLPSCGQAGTLCGQTPMCCPASAACSQGEVGPSWDCERCCVGSCS